MYSYPPSNIVSTNASPGDNRGSREGSLGSITGTTSPTARSFSTIFMQPWTKADQRKREVEALNNLQTVQARRKGWMDVLSSQPRDFPPPVPTYGQRPQQRQQEIIAHAYPNGPAHLNPNQQFFSQSTVDWRNFNGDSSQSAGAPMSPFQFAIEKRISGLQSSTPDHGSSPTARGLSFPVSPMANPNTDKNLMRQLIDLEHTLKAEREARMMNEEALSTRCSLLSDELSNLQRRYTDLSVGGSYTPSRSRFSAFQQQQQPGSQPNSPSQHTRRSLVPMISEDSPQSSASRRGSDFIQRRNSSDFVLNEGVKVSATLVPTWSLASSERKSFAFLQSQPKPSPLSPHRLEERLFSDSASAKPSATVGYPESMPATPKDLAREAPPGPRPHTTPPRISPQFAAQQAPVYRTGGAMDGGFRSVMPPPAQSMDSHWRGAAPSRAVPMSGMRSSTGMIDGGWRGISGSLDHTSVLRASTGTLDGTWAPPNNYSADIWRHASGSVSQPGNTSNVSTVHVSRFAGMDRAIRQHQPPAHVPERYGPPGPAFGAPSHQHQHQHQHQPQPSGGGGMYTHNNTVNAGSNASFMHMRPLPELHSRPLPERPLPVRPEPPAPRAREVLYAPPTAQERKMNSKMVPVQLPSRVQRDNEMLGGYPTPLKKAIALTDQLKREAPRPRSGDYVGTPWQTGEIRARLEEVQRQRMAGERVVGETVTPGSVGLVLQRASFGSGVLVAQVVPGLPAKLDGTIRAGDMLTMVEEWSANGRSLEEVQQRLEGREGSVVLLTMVRFLRDMRGNAEGVQQLPFSVRLRRSARNALPSSAAAYRGFA